MIYTTFFKHLILFLFIFSSFNSVGQQSLLSIGAGTGLTKINGKADDFDNTSASGNGGNIWLNFMVTPDKNFSIGVEYSRGWAEVFFPLETQIASESTQYTDIEKTSVSSLSLKTRAFIGKSETRLFLGLSVSYLNINPGGFKYSFPYGQMRFGGLNGVISVEKESDFQLLWEFGVLVKQLEFGLLIKPSSGISFSTTEEYNGTRRENDFTNNFPIEIDFTMFQLRVGYNFNLEKKKPNN